MPIIRAGGLAKLRCTLPLLRREPVNQREPVETFPKPSYEIILPALGAQSTSLPDLLHRHALDQNVMHQRRTIGTEFELRPVQPQHCVALALGNRLLI